MIIINAINALINAIIGKPTARTASSSLAARQLNIPEQREVSGSSDNPL
jgi:hypothetical protein